MASGVISASRRHPKAGRKNFSALRFSKWVFSARNGGLERLSRNQSAHSLKVFLAARTIGEGVKFGSERESDETATFTQLSSPAEPRGTRRDRKSTRLNSSHLGI